MVTTATDTLSTIANSLVALATISGVAIAGFGLSTWRKQLKGTTEYELAKRLLLQVYRIRDAVGYVRQPFLMVGEAGEPKKGVPWEVAAYENRWKGVRDAMIEFDAVSLECEVIWGKEILNMKSKLTRQIIMLNHAIESFVQSKYDKAFQEDFTAELRDRLYSRGDDDAYNKEFNKVVKSFENYVKPHLKHSRHE